MGHSAGAHLVALVASDPTYLSAVGVLIEAIFAVVLLDGAGYDIPAQMEEGHNRAVKIFRQAFGTNLQRQRALFPVNHGAAPNVANWLLLPVATRVDARTQSAKLVEALAAGGARVEVKPQLGKTHMSLNREFGMAGDASTKVVDTFLAKLR